MPKMTTDERLRGYLMLDWNTAIVVGLACDVCWLRMFGVVYSLHHGYHENDQYWH